MSEQDEYLENRPFTIPRITGTGSPKMKDRLLLKPHQLVPAIFILTTFSLYAGVQKPNVVVFLVDDMGIMDTSLPFLKDDKGQPTRHPLNNFYRTPNMERLAKQGIRFSQFYAMSVCSPSRISILTGQTSARHHTTQFINPDSNNAGTYGATGWLWEGPGKDHVLLPALLHESGYRTIHCGKAHFGPIGAYAENPINLGFDVNIAGCSYSLPGSYYAQNNFGNGETEKTSRSVPGLEKYHGTKIFLTEALTREIKQEIKSAVKARQPFFAYISHYAAHAPFQSDPRFAEHYKGTEKSLAAFATLIEGVDKSLGDILDHLDELGVAEDTLVFFLGDNGTDAPNGGAHDISCAVPFRGKKGTHYEGGMRVPFIAAWARPNAGNPLQKQTPIATGTLSDNMGTVYDLFPTILSVTGIQPPSKIPIDGVNLRPLLSGQSKQEIEREFLMHFPHPHASAYFTVYRKGDWKLIYHYRKTARQKWDQVELFHLAEDPGESHNLAKERSDKCREMMTAMIAALDRSDAQYPLADDRKTLLKPKHVGASRALPKWHFWKLFSLR